MMALHSIDNFEDHTLTVNPAGRSSVVLVCEHASHFIPAIFEDLGLSTADRKSHAAWDPGAMAVAEQLSAHLNAPLVASGVSRLVYDCNRPPEAPDAMPAQSETIIVPGNAHLTAADRAHRTETYYRPFQKALGSVIAQTTAPVIVTIHSFTPIYFGEAREVEIGILHDSDTRLADAMLEVAASHTDSVVRRNAPYGPEHGVTHTLKEHAVAHGHLNVMLEIRNDLIATDQQQTEMAKVLAHWLTAAFALTGVAGDVQCQA